MNGKSLWISIIAVIISFIGGFILANALNRNELDTLRAENARLKSSPVENNPELTLSSEEISQRIAEADRNQDDFKFQKTLGLALYRYATMKQDAEILAQIERILVRANTLDPKDFDIIVALGHLNFDIGYFKKDNERFAKAREFYQKALAEKPKAVDIRTDYALTYFLQNPPDNEKAVAEFRKSLAENPKHQKTLEFLTQALVKQGKREEAETALATLREINPNAPTLSEVEAQISRENNK